MKTLVIVNESFAEMFLGKNTTLAYILAAASSSDVYVWNFAENFCVKIDEKQAEILTKKYTEINRQIRNFSPEVAKVKVKDLIQDFSVVIPAEAGIRDELTIYSEPVVLDPRLRRDDAERKSVTSQKIPNDEFDLIIQRLEPMKAPFPPVGEKNIEDVLHDLRAQFPRHIFNCPLGLHDKELEKFSDIATPTAEFKLSDENYAQAVASMGDAYEKIYQNSSLGGKKKVVIKPKDLAQSLGVFALDLAEEKDVKKACIEHGEELYRGQILAQPFLEGIRQGDIRATIIKNEKGDFECVGYTFRKSLRAAESEDFTTGYIVGGSTPRPISDLTKNEQEDLQKKCEKVLQVLNGELREKYHDVIELGADFILVGNDLEVLLGEINHHCPGLAPITEAMGDEKKYEGGLGIAKRIIEISTSGRTTKPAV